MLATTTTDALCVADLATLKKTPSSLPSCLDLLDIPTASAWSADNSCLYISSAHRIQRYEPTSNILRNIYTHGAAESITYMVARDQECVVFSAESKIHVLDLDQISQTFETHKGPVNSLSLSNDNTLLASTSSGAVHVHNLTLGSHTVMRGLANVDISTCAFLPHSRTRLLVAAGKQLMVFDTTRPSGPMKTIITTGDIVAVACSPFSKTLVAVATSGGFVGLIDLEKEKALFRTLNVKVALTTLGFSPEGATIYLGTETGKILVVDLRALDKPPRSINVSETGSRVQTISIQKKSKNALTKTPIAAATSKKTPVDVPRRTAPKTVPSPARKPSVTSSPSARKVVSTSSPSKRIAVEAKRILSPKRDPHGNSDDPHQLAGQLHELAGLRRGKPSTTPIKKQHSPLENPRRVTTSVSAPASRKPSTASTSTSAARARISSEIVITSGSATSTSRPSSSASRVSRTTTTTATTLESSPVQTRLRAGSVATRASTTPSPDLPDPHLDPVTPVPEQKQRKKGMSVLGLGTPEVDRWIRAGNEDERKSRGKGAINGKGKSVGFEDEEDESDDEDAQERKRILSMQISPRRGVPRAVPSSSSGSADSWNASPALDGSLSAVNGGISGSSAANSSSVGNGASAHELLRTIVQDVMYDFQRDTKAEMMGLHLDLLRMGRGWKTELRTLMDEYVGDLRDLREENQRLRLENERLRRGAY